MVDLKKKVGCAGCKKVKVCHTVSVCARRKNKPKAVR